jgi:hypothetical protein
MGVPHFRTLLDVVPAVSDSTRSEDEVVATVTYLINSGTVRLCGTFAGAKIALHAPPPALGQRPEELADCAPAFLLAPSARRRSKAGSLTDSVQMDFGAHSDSSTRSDRHGGRHRGHTRLGSAPQGGLLKRADGLKQNQSKGER